MSRKGIGELGELLVGSICEQRSYEFVPSKDKYDDEKDIIICGKNVEVKTQFPLLSKEWFTFGANQERKMREADYTLIVAYSNGHSLDWLDKIYVMLPNFVCAKYLLSGKEMIGVRRTDPSIFWWADIPEDVSIALRKITGTKEFLPKISKWDKIDLLNS